MGQAAATRCEDHQPSVEAQDKPPPYTLVDWLEHLGNNDTELPEGLDIEPDGALVKTITDF